MQRAQKITSFLILFFAFLGFLLSFYALFLYIRIQLNPDLVLSCDLSKSFSCSSSLKGPYAALLGLPNGFLGLLYFSWFGFSFLFRRWFQLDHQVLAFYQMVASTLGILGSIFFTLLLHFGVRSFCPICLGIHVINLLLFLVVLKVFCALGVRNVKEQIRKSVGSFLLGSFVLASPFLLIGWLSGPLVAFLKPSSDDLVTETAASWLEPIPQGWSAPVQPNPLDAKNFDLVKGSPHAKLDVIIYSDFACPACQSFGRFYKNLMKELSSFPIRWVYRHLPYDQDCNPLIDFPYHEGSCDLSRLALCAQQQGDFWLLKEEIDQFVLKENFALSQSALSAFQKELIVKQNLNPNHLESCLVNQVFEKKLQRDVESGNALDLKRIPVFLIGNGIYTGPANESSLKHAILHQLKKFDSEFEDQSN